MSQQFLQLLLVLITGGMLAFQGPMNGQMGRLMASPLLATFISFSVGTVFLLLILLFQAKPLPNLSVFTSVPKILWTAGTLGAFFVLVATLLIPKIGAANFLVLSLLGQIVISLVVDHYGYFGIERKTFDLERFIGVGLVLAGVLVANKKALFA